MSDPLRLINPLCRIGAGPSQTRLDSKRLSRVSVQEKPTDAASFTIAGVGCSDEVKRRQFCFLAFAHVVERAHVIRLDAASFHAHHDLVHFPPRCA